MYLTEAIGAYALLNNRSAKPEHPLSIVIADEVHERTMYTQMIIGLARNQMAGSTGMVLILMSATVDVEELKQSSPGAREIEIDRHEYVVKRYFLERPITKNDNLLEQTARLIVTVHHEHGNKNLVEGVPSGQFCECGYTRGLEIKMSSGEDPSTWTYFDRPAEDHPVMGRGQPYYMNANGVEQMRPRVKDGNRIDPPYADEKIIEQLYR